MRPKRGTPSASPRRRTDSAPRICSTKSRCGTATCGICNRNSPGSDCLRSHGRKPMPWPALSPRFTRYVGSPGSHRRCSRPRPWIMIPARIPCTLLEVFSSVEAGQRIWFDDGTIGGVVESATAAEIRVRIRHARPGRSRLLSDKGINLPDTDLRLPALTQKDPIDLDFAPSTPISSGSRSCATRTTFWSWKRRRITAVRRDAAWC